MSVVTLNEELGVLDEDALHAAWVVKDRKSGMLLTIAADRATAEHIIMRKVKEYNVPADTYSLEVWHIHQSPEEYS